MMIIELQNMIDDNFSSFYDNIKLRLSYLLTNHKRFLYIELNKTINGTIQKVKGESKSDYLKRIFREDPLFIINNLIDEIYSFSFSEKIAINPCNIYFDSNRDKKIIIREKIKLSDIKYLTEVKSLNLEVKNYVDINSSVIKSDFYIESLNHFTNEVIIFGEIEFDELAVYAIDNMYIDLNFEYKGLQFENMLPIWLEHIIEGVLYQCNKNTKHAIFNYFVAFDSFVQTAYNQIHKYYHHKRIDYEEILNRRFDDFIDELKEEFIDGIIEAEYGLEDEFQRYDEAYDEAYDVAYSEVSLLKNDIIYDHIKIYLENYEEMLAITKRKMSSDYEYYSRQDKKLINQKLKDVENILDINLNTTNFSGLSTLKSSIKTIEKQRNNIAHGNGAKLNFSGNEFYDVFTYIVSIIYNYDFDKTCWSELLRFI